MLTPAQRARLERLGRDGRALTGAVDATAPQSAGSSGPQSVESDGQRLGDGAGISPLDKTIDALGGSDDGDGLGVLLPAILLTALLGTLALVIMRRRSAS